ncbi:MAG: hypothetical protein PHX25_01125 [Candidatus Pacebacteria bacterium]|nr:hypothetical protein [Candidatus Paceibacterota bacterium]
MKSLFLTTFFVLFVSGCSEKVIHDYSGTIFQCRLNDGTIIFVNNLEECKQTSHEIKEEILVEEALPIKNQSKSFPKEVEEIRDQYHKEDCYSFRNSDPKGWCSSGCRKAYSDIGFCMLFDP